MIAERGYTYNPFTEDARWPMKRYVVWDADSGNAIGTIEPRKQWRPAIGERTPRQLGASLVFAVSPNGGAAALVAEDCVEIFKIPSVPGGDERPAR